MSKFKEARVVVIGTGSAIKIEAVREAFSGAVEVLSKADARSGVSAQPVGREETRRGALNCAQEARVEFPNADAWLGIENGVWPCERTPLPVDPNGLPCPREDAACVAILLPAASGDRNEPPRAQVVWSDALPIPHAEHLSFGRGPGGEWSELKDPHAVLTEGRKPRKAFLVEALQKALLMERDVV